MNEAIAKEIIRLQGLERTTFSGEQVYLEIADDHVQVVSRDFQLEGTPMSVWCGCVRSICLPHSVTPAAAAAFINVNANLIADVMSGIYVDWDGSNNIGGLTPEGKQALRMLDSVVEGWEEYTWRDGASIPVMGVSEFFAPLVWDLQHAATADKAVSLALECLDDDGAVDFGDGIVYVGLDEAEEYARSVWAEAHDDEE